MLAMFLKSEVVSLNKPERKHIKVVTLAGYLRKVLLDDISEIKAIGSSAYDNRLYIISLKDRNTIILSSYAEYKRIIKKYQVEFKKRKLIC